MTSAPACFLLLDPSKARVSVNFRDVFSCPDVDYPWRAGALPMEPDISTVSVGAHWHPSVRGNHQPLCTSWRFLALAQIPMKKSTAYSEDLRTCEHVLQLCVLHEECRRLLGDTDQDRNTAKLSDEADSRTRRAAFIQVHGGFDIEDNDIRDSLRPPRQPHLPVLTDLGDTSQKSDYIGPGSGRGDVNLGNVSLTSWEIGHKTVEDEFLWAADALKGYDRVWILSDLLTSLFPLMVNLMSAQTTITGDMPSDGESHGRTHSRSLREEVESTAGERDKRTMQVPALGSWILKICNLVKINGKIVQHVAEDILPESTAVMGFKAMGPSFQLVDLAISAKDPPSPYYIFTASVLQGPGATIFGVLTCADLKGLAIVRDSATFAYRSLNGGFGRNVIDHGTNFCPSCDLAVSRVWEVLNDVELR
ncbi:hypothetical protein BS47DRAFT_1391899 [Hydnum rufescens UP504]|uniref:Uncharacterized protein n=1 Tax=Hydnum rufescens UP504 TaxID=1448309 RepID=A0A9P6B0E9_9AGAM|nr:hypothetical protein BS47DRAFT_1391899 [Hydnum rufescens UP504]